MTSRRGWLSLAALWLVLASVIAWSILGRVPTTETGKGILVAGGGLTQVVAEGTGRLESINVKLGDTIAKGAVVAVISQPEMAEQLEEARSQLAEVRRQHTSMDDYDKLEKQRQEDLDRIERKRLEQAIEFGRHRQERLAARRTTVEELLGKGMMTPIDVDRIDEELETVLSEIEKSQLEMEQVAAAAKQGDFRRERDAMKRSLEADMIESRVTLLASRLERESRVVSQFDGRVVEIRAAQKAAISVGDPVLLLEPGGGELSDLEALLYVPAGTGKRIELGMRVMLQPSTVKREEHGGMLGTVSYLATVPTSKPAMSAVLSDADLVEEFTREIGLPLEMRVRLTPDPGTPSGYKWTSRSGPPVRISAGTLCTGWVTVREQRPISLVFPFIGKSLGAD